ncbi:GIY-YIG nuclease family protein [Polaribacter batillariae]|uniref:GIY-YIG nuclease family protein n=1 Tax=Polaribacter batillariae TaxID=2808900 RepID=UPI00349ECD3D
MLTNKHKTVLYTGVTNNLTLRLQQHQEKKNPKSFIVKYNVHYLLFYEHFGWIQEAIVREKEIKNLTRQKKINFRKNAKMEFLNHSFE